MSPIPDFDEMWAYFPTGESEDVRDRIGGGVDADHITNTCVIRVSRCLNYTGNPIPKSSEEFVTKLGKDKKHYGLRVKEFKKYMLKTYGKPTLKHTFEGDGGPVPDVFKNRRGIIMFDVRVWTDATGHFTLWNGKTCADKCHFDKAKEVWLWSEKRKPSEVSLAAGALAKLVTKLSGEIIEATLTKK